MSLYKEEEPQERAPRLRQKPRSHTEFSSDATRLYPLLQDEIDRAIRRCDRLKFSQDYTSGLSNKFTPRQVSGEEKERRSKTLDEAKKEVEKAKAYSKADKERQERDEKAKKKEAQEEERRRINAEKEAAKASEEKRKTIERVKMLGHQALEEEERQKREKENAKREEEDRRQKKKRETELREQERKSMKIEEKERKKREHEAVKAEHEKVKREEQERKQRQKEEAKLREQERKTMKIEESESKKLEHKAKQESVKGEEQERQKEEVESRHRQEQKCPIDLENAKREVEHERKLRHDEKREADETISRYAQEIEEIKNAAERDKKMREEYMAKVEEENKILRLAIKKAKAATELQKIDKEKQNEGANNLGTKLRAYEAELSAEKRIRDEEKKDLSSSHEYIRRMESELQNMQRGFLSLTTQYARMQFQLRQVLAAPTNERDTLLQGLRKLAYGMEDETKLTDEFSPIKTDARAMGSVKSKQNKLIATLRWQLDDLLVATSNLKEERDHCYEIEQKRKYGAELTAEEQEIEKDYEKCSFSPQRTPHFIEKQSSEDLIELCSKFEDDCTANKTKWCNYLRRKASKRELTQSEQELIIKCETVSIQNEDSIPVIIQKYPSIENAQSSTVRVSRQRKQ